MSEQRMNDEKSELAHSSFIGLMLSERVERVSARMWAHNLLVGANSGKDKRDILGTRYRAHVVWLSLIGLMYVYSCEQYLQLVAVCELYLGVWTHLHVVWVDVDIN